ncbi:MAG: DNA cytosine methyltransferase, partial [Tepidamorphaceae bacterium]
MALHSPASPGHERLAGIALCAGVGGLELGLHIAEPGYRSVCFVEREAFPASVLVARMEDKALDHAPIWDDVASFDGRPWRGKVDILTAGYPCQPFSSAGKQRGRHDPRHLWPQVERIVTEAGPRWVFCENVEGHLDLGFAEVARRLQAMGYSVKAGLFSAAEAGASHIRRRLFILAHADDIALLQQDGATDRPEGPALRAVDRPNRQASGDRQGGAGVDVPVADQQGFGDAAVRDAGIPLFAPAPCELSAWEQ